MKKYSEKIPNNFELKLPLIFIMNSLGEKSSIKDISEGITELLDLNSIYLIENDIKIPVSEILHIQTEGGTTKETELDYRLAWVRTELKNSAGETYVERVSKGMWKLSPYGLKIAKTLTKDGVAKDYFDRMGNLEKSSPDFEGSDRDNTIIESDANNLLEHVSPYVVDPDVNDEVEYRNQIIEYLNRFLYGPRHDFQSHKNIINEELKQPPTIYGTGVLFNEADLLKVQIKNNEEGDVDFLNDDDDSSAIELSDKNDNLEKQEIAKKKTEVYEEEYLKTDWNDEVALSNDSRPSTCGISFSAMKNSKLAVSIYFGTYSSEKRLEKVITKEDVIKNFHIRKQNKETILIDLADQNKRFVKYKISNSNNFLELRSEVSSPKVNNNQQKNITLFLRNTSLEKGWKNYFYQVSLSIESIDSKSVFLPIISRTYDGTINEDERLEFLYRDKKSFARGHGVSADWEIDGNQKYAKKIFTEFLPKYEIKPIEPRKEPFNEINSFTLNFYDLSKFSDRDSILPRLENFCNDYKEWIADQDNSFKSSEDSKNDRFIEIASQNIKECEKTLGRMLDGIKILSEDESSMRAFCYMNEAMMMQQWHSSLKNKKKEEVGKKNNETYEIDGEKRSWYPFQLAFILINIRGMCRQEERDFVDLIWFPTGGGKTEAYLGLSAFTICYKKLKNPENGGTIVLMRYTLRLLTSQQLLRAIPLIMALEKIRQRDTSALGKLKIDIGLWVGNTTTPNNKKAAMENYSQLKLNSYEQNKLQILNCPWCKTDLVEKDTSVHKCPGYFPEVNQSGVSSVVFKCPDKECDFYNEVLPIKVVDEDLYESPPTFLIGTVDKFAQLAWRNETSAFFGIGNNFDPPELIIQDELHLISGPLGSVVGHYESAMDILCSNGDILPKIIASTATIRQSEEQIKLLYNRKLNQFPPQAITFGNTYFAQENKKKFGRYYFGFFPSAVSSNRLAEQQVAALLLQKAVMPYLKNVVYEEEGSFKAKFEEGFNKSNIKKHADPYTTMVWYFNTLKDLGYNATNLQDGVQSEIRNIKTLLKLPSILHRRTENVELTSRLPSHEIPITLKRLDQVWSPQPRYDEYEGVMPLDIVFSTNMISVGVDIDRLGLMLINGQPNNSAEYIQASSRVGRKYPGLVITLYGRTKSRDKSIYENFKDFHQSIYRNVESSGLTPFTKKVRDRALGALIIILAKLKLKISEPKELTEKNVEDLKEILVNYYDRILSVTGDKRERDEAKKEADKFINNWLENKNDYDRWGKSYGEFFDKQFMYSLGETLVGDEGFIDSSESIGTGVLNSMRNVDTTCVGRIVPLTKLKQIKAK